jgi:hypothetical protein
MSRITHCSHVRTFARSQRIFKPKDVKSVPTLCVQGPYSEHCDFGESLLFLHQFVSPVSACATSEFHTRIRPVEPTEFTPFISVAVKLTAAHALTLTGGCLRICWRFIGHKSARTFHQNGPCSRREAGLSLLPELVDPMHHNSPFEKDHSAPSPIKCST